MAGGGSPDRAAATAPNLQAGGNTATASGGIAFGPGRRFTFVPLGPPIPFGAAPPPGFPPPDFLPSGFTAVIDRTAPLYCYVCDNTDHDMSWCPVLRAPRPSATLCGHGSSKSAFLQLPNSVCRPDLAPPTAVVTVTEGRSTASQVEDIITSLCLVPFPSSWKWEAIPHGDNAFLVSFPSPEDLRRIISYQVRLPTLGVALDFSKWKGEEAPSDLRLVWVHVKGVPHSLRHFLGLWAIGSVVGSTQDVDLLCLRRRGIIRVQVAVLGKEVFPLAHAVVLENQRYMLHYSLQKEDFEADADFVPKAWDRGDDQLQGFESYDRGEENNGSSKAGTELCVVVSS